MSVLNQIINKVTFFKFLCSPTRPLYIKGNDHISIGSQTLAFFDATRSRPITMELFYPAETSAQLKPQTPLGTNLWKRIPEFRKAPIARHCGQNFGQHFAQDFEKKPNQNLSQPSMKWPLIMFSHGHGGSRIESAWLFYELVNHGYVVASIDHFGDTWDLVEDEEAAKRWHRAQDISFAARALLNHPKFGNGLDANNIGFAGFSLGGLTGLWLVGGKANLIEETLKNEPKILADTDLSLAKKSYYDPLIKAAFLMAPAYARAFDPESLQNISTPVYIITGAGDTIVLKENAEYLAKWIPLCQLKILPGKVGHYVFLNLPTRLGKIILPHDIILVQAASNLNKIHNETAKEAIRFFDHYLKNS